MGRTDRNKNVNIVRDTHQEVCIKVLGLIIKLQILQNKIKNLTLYKE